MLCAVCLFAIEEPLYEPISEHLSTLQQISSYLTNEGLLHTQLVSVPGVLNPYIAKKLESAPPPRPLLPPLDEENTRQGLDHFMQGMSSGIHLQRLDDWLSIEAHFLDRSRGGKVAMPYLRSLHQVNIINLSNFNEWTDARVVVHLLFEWEDLLAATFEMVRSVLLQPGSWLS